MVLKKKKQATPSGDDDGGEDEDDGFKTRMDKAKKRFEETAGDGNFWKPQSGKNYIRVLPPWGKGAKGNFFFVGGLHYGFKIGGRDRAIPCPVFAERGRCPVCELVDKLKANSDYKDLSRELSIRKKYWVNLVERTEGSENADDKPKIQIYGGNKKFINAILDAFDEDDYGDITSPDEGHDIKVFKKGEGLQTRYTVTVRPRPSALGIPDWKKQIHKLDEVVIEWMSEKEIEAAIAKNYGEEAVEVGFKLSKKKSVKEDDDEEDEKPKKKRPKDEDEDEDEDDENEDDDDE